MLPVFVQPEISTIPLKSPTDEPTIPPALLPRIYPLFVQFVKVALPILVKEEL